MLHYWQVAIQYSETGMVPEHVAIMPLGTLLVFGVVLTYGLWQDRKDKKGDD